LVRLLIVLRRLLILRLGCRSLRNVRRLLGRRWIRPIGVRHRCVLCRLIWLDRLLRRGLRSCPWA